MKHIIPSTNRGAANGLLHTIVLSVLAAMPTNLRAGDDASPRRDANRLAYLNSADACYFGSGVEDFAATAWRAKQSLGEVVIVDLSRIATKMDTVRLIVARFNRGELPGAVLRIDGDRRRPYRLIDLDGDRALDLVGGPTGDSKTLLWSREKKDWLAVPFPTEVDVDSCRWGIVRKDGAPSFVIRSVAWKGAWYFSDGKWVADARLLSGLEVDGRRVFTDINGRDRGVRLHDLDGEGCPVEALEF